MGDDDDDDDDDNSKKKRVYVKNENQNHVGELRVYVKVLDQERRFLCPRGDSPFRD